MLHIILAGKVAEAVPACISSPDGQGGIAPVSESGGGCGRYRRASGAPVSSVTMREDTVRYIRWVETVVDGVETRAQA